MLPSNGGRRSPGLSCASVHELVSPVAILTQDLHFYPTGGRTESHSLNSLLRYIAFIVISQELQPPEVPMSAVPDEDPCPRAAAGPPSLELAFLQSVFAELSGLRGRAPGDAADGTAAEDRAPGTDSSSEEHTLSFTGPGHAS